MGVEVCTVCAAGLLMPAQHKMGVGCGGLGYAGGDNRAGR